MTRFDKIIIVFSASRAALCKLKYQILPICLVFIGIACNEPPEKGPYQDFYFPFEELEGGLIYEYESIGKDNVVSEFWFYKSIKDENGWHLTGTYYDEYFQVRQFFREDMHQSGSIMADYFLYQPDSTGKLIRYDAELKVANGFPFALKDTNSVLLFDIQWTFSEDPLHKLSLIRNRQYREKSQFSFQGERIPAIILDLRELIDDEQDGHLEKEYTGVEIYGKGIGLVYYRKDLGNNLLLEYQLKDMYTMSDFEKKFKAVIN